MTSAIKIESTTQTIKAARVHEWGGPEVLKIEEIPQPQPTADEVLVRVHAAGINPADWGTRQGYRAEYYTLPAVIGYDLAGEVIAVGKNVENFKVGDGVYALSLNGAFAEIIALPAANLAHKPASLDYIETASLPVVAIAAWMAIEVANLQAGQKILIHAAAGGIGHLAVQFAKLKGAYVIGTASADNENFVRGLGADEFINYRTARFEDVVSDLDVVLDNVGDETQKRSYGVLKKGGLLITEVGLDNPNLAEQYGVRTHEVWGGPHPEILTEVGKLIDAGQVKVTIAKVFPFDQLTEAIEHVKAGHVRGKVVVKIAE